MSEDHETESAAPDEPSPSGAPPSRRASKPLSPKVERALAAAREAARADRERKAGRWLAAFPVTVGAILLALMMPRATVPDAAPLPAIHGGRLHEVERADDARAAAATHDRLPSEVLAVGSALRDLNGVEVRGGDDVQKIDARRRLEASVHSLPLDDRSVSELLSLRAVQMAGFLAGVARWESTGEANEDLVELGGNFIRTIQDAGWVEDRRVLLSASERRVAFKLVWNTLVGVDRRPAFAPTLDEQRALYAFYIRHPHPSESQRLGLANDLASAKTPEACARSRTEHAKQSALWLVDKLKRFGSIDPTYPTQYALGVAYYQAGRFDQSAEAFSAFIQAHPDGDYALLAKNHLKAALLAHSMY